MIKKEVTTLNESNFYKKNNHNDLHKKKKTFQKEKKLKA
jgi:hypothetical protein